MAEDKVKNLYDTFVSEGYDMESEEEFRNNLADATKRRNAYDALVADGYEMEDYETFEKNIGFSASPSQPKVETSTTPQSPMEQIATEQGWAKSAIPTEELPSAPHPQSTISQVREEQEAEEQAEIDAMATPITSKIVAGMQGNATPSLQAYQKKMDDIDLNLKMGAITPQEADVQRRSEMLGEMSSMAHKPSEKQMRRVNAEQVGKLREIINDKLAQRGDEVEKEYAKNDSFAMNLTRGGGMAAMPTYARTGQGKLADLEYNTLVAAKRSLDDAQAIIDEADRNINPEEYSAWQKNWLNGLGRGIGEELFDVRTWDMGINEMKDSAVLLNALNKADNGEELTEAEEALLDAKALEMATNAYFGSYLGRAYKAGQTSAQSIPFMLEMAINPLSAVGKTAQNKLVRWALKKYGKGLIEKKLKYGALKYGSRLAGDLVGSAGMTLTTSLPTTIADTNSRMSGDVMPTYDDRGVASYGGHEGGVSAGKAIRQAITAGTLERFSEMMGYYFTPMLKAAGKPVSKMMDAPRLAKVNDFLGKVSATDLARGMADFQRRTRWDGVFGEYLEEVANNHLNALLVGDMEFNAGDKGVYNRDTNIDTFLGVSVIGGGMSAIQTGYYPIYKYRQHRALNKADRYAGRAFGSDWEGIKSQLTNIDDSIKQPIADILQNEDYTPEQKRAALDYVKAKARMKGMQDAEISKYTDPEIPTEQKEIAASYDVGRSLHTPEEMNEAKMKLEEAANALRERFLLDKGADIDAFLGDNAINSIINSMEMGGSVEEAQLKLNYLNAKATYDGMCDQTGDNVRDEIEESNHLIDSRVNKETGRIQTAKIGAENDLRDVFIVGGNVELLDGNEYIDRERSSKDVIVMDAATGKLEMTTSDQLREVKPSLDVSEVKAQAANEIETRNLTDVSNRIDGVLPFAVGDVYTIADKDGAVHQASVMLNNGDGTAMVSIDGAEAKQVTTADIQAMANAYKSIQRAERKAQAEQAERDTFAEVEQEAQQKEAQAQQEAEKETIPATSSIPVDENGNRQYTQVDADTAWDALMEQTEGDAEMAMDVANAMTKKAEKALEDVKKESVAEGNTPEEMIAAKKAHKDKVAQAQAEVDKWNAISSTPQRRAEKAETEARAEAVREDGQLLILPSEISEEVGALSDPTHSMPSVSKDTTSEPQMQEAAQEKSALQKNMEQKMRMSIARSVQQKEGRFYKEDAELGAPIDFRDYVMRAIARGGVKFIWGNNPRTGSRGLGSHTGFGEQERRKRIGILSNEGMYPEVAAERLLASYADEIGYDPRIDTMDALGEIIDVVMSYTTPKEMMQAAQQRHQEIEERNREAEEEMAYQAYLEGEAAKRGMSVAEYLREEEMYEEVIAAELPLREADKDKIDAIFAEQYLEEYENERRNQSIHQGVSGQARNGASDKGSSDILPTAGSNQQGNVRQSAEGQRTDAQADNEGNNNLPSRQARRDDASTTEVTPQQEAANKYAKALVKRINEWAKALGVEAVIYSSVDEVESPQARENLKKGAKITGWYDNGKIYFYLPNLRDVSEVNETFIHETVAHHGMRALLGEEGYRDLCRLVYDEVMTDEQKAHYLDYVRKYEPVEGGATSGKATYEEKIAAGDEFMAFLAENTYVEYSSAFDKVASMVRKTLRAIGFDVKLSGAELREMLRQSYKNLESGKAKTTEGKHRARVTSTETNPYLGRSLTSQESKAVIALMENNAQSAPELELTPENWVAEFGEDGIVSTPIGDVKMGEHQYLKLLQRKRSEYFGLIKPTLTDADIILEEYDPKEGAERDTKLLFVKTFVKEDGSRYIHFESVTVQKDTKEVSISSHEINATDLQKKMHNDKVVHLKDAFLDSELRLIEPQAEGSDIVPTPNASSDNKDTTTKPQKQDISKENAEAAVVIDDFGGDLTSSGIRFNVRTDKEVVANRERQLRRSVRNGVLSNSEANEIREASQAMLEIAEVIAEAKKANGEAQFPSFSQWNGMEVILNSNGEPVVSVIKANGEYPMNLDFAKDCIKRDATNRVLNKLAQLAPDVFTSLTNEQLADINNIIKRHGLSVPCVGCFVEAKRYRQADNARSVVNAWNMLVDAVSSQTETAAINELGNKQSIKGIVSHLKKTPSDMIHLSEDNIVAPDKYAALMVEHPQIPSLLQQTQGQNNAQLVVPEAVYYGDILNLPADKAWDVDAAYSVGGVRLQSFSDFKAKLFFDYCQVLADLASKRLPAHTYTKVPSYAELFGLTGMKINLSLFFEGKGIDENGEYIYSRESIDPSFAYDIQSREGYTENVGTMAVGVSDEHIKKMLADDRIRSISPYHKSGINPLVAKKINATDFVDYSNEQNAVVANSEKEATETWAEYYQRITARINGAVPKYGNKFVPKFNLYDDLLETDDPILTAKNYVEYCQNNGIVPKFAHFVYNEDGSFNDGYYKLLYDFAVTNKDGNYTPQGAVKWNKSSMPANTAEILTSALEVEEATLSKNQAQVDAVVDDILKEVVNPRFRVSAGQPIEGYTSKDIIDIITPEIENVLNENDVEGVEIAEVWLHGSRMRGDARQNSDLDAVMFYQGNTREDDLFNLIAENNITIGEVKVDVNPIQIDSEEDITRYKQKSQQYDAEKLTQANGKLRFRVADYTAEEQKIIAQAKANGTYLKAPNGADTNLTPKQWIQVRTKAFKNWFGDWEKAARIEKLRNSEAISITADDYNGYTLDRANAKEWLKKNVRGEYTNADTAEQISVTNVGINEVTSHGSQSTEHLKSLSAIPQMIENSIFIDELPNNKDHNKYDSYRYYVCGLKIDGVDYTAKIVVGVKGDSKYYDHRLTEIEKGSLIDNLNSLSNAVAENQDSLVSVSKDTKLNEILQTNSSKIVDANGEPKVVYHQTNATQYINVETGENWDDLDWRAKMEWDERDDWDEYWQEQDFYEFSRANARITNEFDGFFFAPEYDQYHEYGERTIAAFLNIRKPAFRGDYNIDSSKNEAGRNERIRLQGEGYDGVIRESDGVIDEYVAFEPNQIKSATDNVGTFDAGNNDIRFRVAPTFYSNAENAVKNIKQEKATPEQWLKMIEKNGGLKAGEDKWLGLSDWLKASDKKTLTKQEVMEYIRQNQIQIEEVEYTAEVAGFDVLKAEYDALLRSEGYDAAHDAMIDRFGDDFDIAFSDLGGELIIEDEEAAATLLGSGNIINDTRLQYTTYGLDKKREIALVVPTIESWNEYDNVHFGDAGEGRAIAWVRFGETTDDEGRRVLVIDEVQSKRHQEGREKGYKNPRVNEILDRINRINSAMYSGGISTEMHEERNKLNAELETLLENENPVLKNVAEQLKEKNKRLAELQREKASKEEEERVEIYRLQLKQNEVRNNRDYDYYESEINNLRSLIDSRNEEIKTLKSDIAKLEDEYSRYQTTEVRNASIGVDPAPFEKNWAELAMKRMLRYAAENGFDKVAWTTGEQQAERYNLGAVMQGLTAYKTSPNTYYVTPYNNGAIGEFVKEYNEAELAETFGKEIAVSIITNAENATEENPYEMTGDDLRIVGSGLKVFYDQMIPSFMNKYGKKWGVRVGEVTMPNLEQNNTMHSVDVTESMRESVMQGQPMFRVAYPARFKDMQREYDALDKSDEMALNAWRDEKADVVRGYLEKIAQRFGMKPEIVVFNGADEKQMKAAYDRIVESYKKNGDSNPPSFEAFKKHSSNPDVIATYRRGGKIITHNVSANDANCNKDMLAGILFHENTHHLAYILFSDDKRGELWSDVANAKYVIVKHIKDNYGNKSYESKGGEFIAYSIETLATKHKKSFLQFIEGENMTAGSLVEKLKYKEINANFAIIDVLNAIKNEYTESRERRDENRFVGGVGYGSNLSTTERNPRSTRGRIDTRGRSRGSLLVTPEQQKFYDTVAKNGLRRVVGNENYDEFLFDVFQQVDNTTRGKIVNLATTNGWNFLNATEQFFVSLAENNNAERGFFEKLRDLFVDMLRKVGIIIGNDIADNDLLYMLWRTYQMQHSKGAVAVAEDVVMQQKLGVGNFRARVSQDIERDYPNWLEGTTTESGKHSTQVEGTRKTYNKVGDWIEEHLGKDVSILDASSGMGYGTADLRERGFNIEDVEPYQSEERKKNNPATYSSYDDIHKQYDYIISNAVLNVIPDDWRADVLHNMANALKQGGKMFINTRKAGEEKAIKDKIELDTPQEVLVKRNGRIASYQRFFTPTELKKWIESELGDGYEVEVANQKNSGTKGLAAVVVTKKKDGTDGSTRFRIAKPSKGEAQDYYNKAVRTPNKSGSVKKSDNLAHRLQEAYQDSMLSVRALMEGIRRETGAPYIKDMADVYTAENRLSSTNKAQIEVWECDFFAPLMEAVIALTQKGVKYEDIVEYIVAKHGLERNLVFSQRDAEKDGGVWDGFVKKDYSGLTELTGEADRFTEAAQQIVDEFEQNYNTQNLWDAINNATKATLKKSFDSGMMSKETYENITTMFKNYVPLRGWAKDVAADEYEYMGSSNMKILPTIKTAKGRTSLAEDPLATIGTMGESAIIQGNKNLMKQKLLNLALQYPTSLLSVSEQWYVQEADGRWRPDAPHIPEGTPDEMVADIIAQFEARMESLGDKAKKQRAGLEIDLQITKKEGQEHAVRVRRNGKEYVVYVNGNPIAAQAINGFTNPNAATPEDWMKTLKEKTETIKNYMARAFTSANPAFVISNLSRDVIWAGTAVAIKENAAYTKQYAKNITREFLKAELPRFVYKWQNGTLDENVPIERFFKEFLLNGGETGFTQLNTVDDYKRTMRKKLKEAQKGHPARVMKALGGIVNGIEFLNRSAEDTTRFAVYLTSRQMGRSVARSIDDAKNITVNFNKKGRGNMGAAALGYMYIFFNAAVQSIANFGKLVKEHPIKTAAWISAYGSAGFLTPLITMAIQSLIGDDDDNYWNLPEWVRRNNIVLPLGANGYVTIPLPHELRPFYALGEIAFSILAGKEDVEDGLRKAVAGFADMSPVDLTGNGGNMLINLTPTFVQPIAQIAKNTDYFGVPIYKDTPFNQNDPEWTKAYKGTPPLLVNGTRVWNEIWGGDAVKSSAIDEKGEKKALGFLTDVNPAVIEHLFESYLGGMGKTYNKLAKTIGMIWNEDLRTMRNVPILSSFVYFPDERNGVGGEVNTLYYDATDEARETERLVSGYKKQVKMGAEEYAAKLDEFLKSPLYQRYKVNRPRRNEINRLRKELEDKDVTNPDSIEQAIFNVKEKMIKELEELESRGYTELSDEESNK